MYHLTNYERETIINFNEGEDTASVYTHNKALRRRLEQLAQERPEECRLFKVSHEDQAVEYYISAKRRGSSAEPPQRPILPKIPRFIDVQEGEEPKTGKDTSQPLDGKKEA